MKQKINKNLLVFGFIGTYIVVALLPLLFSGYYSDDMVNSVIRPTQELEGGTFFKYYVSANKSWISANGRLFPVSSFLTGLIYYYSNNLSAYKIIILLLVIIDIFLFGYFIKLLTNDKYLSYLLMLVVPSFFQYRLYHDPILSFGGLLQILFLMLLLSLIFLQKFLISRKYSYLAVSVIFFNLCLYSYEVSFVLLPVWLFLIFQRRGNFKRALALTYPFLLSFLLAVTLNVLARFIWRETSATGYIGTKFNFNIAAILRTFYLQLGSAIPLSYYLGNPSRIFNHTISYLLLNFKLLYGLIMSIFTIAYVNLSKRVRFEIEWKNFVIPGIIFFLFPAFLISLSDKYQQELNRYGFGMGYLPVYIEYFGLLMIFAGSLLLLLKSTESARVRKFISFILLISLNLILLVNLESNSVVVDKANIDLFYRRTALEHSLENNILGGVPENSKILIVDQYIYDPYPPYIVSDFKGWASYGNRWKNRALVYMHSGKRVAVFDRLSDLIGGSNIQNVQNGKVDCSKDNDYLLMITSYPEEYHVKEGRVLFGKIKCILMNKTDISKAQLEINEKKIYDDRKKEMIDYSGSHK